MNDKEFNEYCCDVIGWEFKIGTLRGACFAFKDGGWTEINPYDDLNQMAEVVEKILFTSTMRQDERYLQLMENVDTAFPFKQAFRDFIWSTKDD